MCGQKEIIGISRPERMSGNGQESSLCEHEERVTVVEK